MPTVKEKIDLLADLHSYRDNISLQKQKVIDSILTPEIKAQISDVEAEFSEALETANANIENLKAEIKADVLSLGESVKGDFMTCQFTKGRVTYDTKRLEGYAAAYPEILAFRKVGDPSVSFTWKGKES